VHDFRVVTSSPGRGNHAFEVVIARGSRFFAGHFPQKPILPAVAHLFVVGHLLRRSLGRKARIVSVDRYRLLEPIGPGDRLSVLLELRPDSFSGRFTLDREGARVSQGDFEWALGGR
jgi:3-hydroxyacyl-[acyl-carrier-protein] dehydratase